MPPQIHIISCTKQKQNPQFPSCFLAERKQQAGIITFAVTIWHKWGLPSSWRFLTLPASDVKLGWLNPSSEFLNWETENGSSCTRRFWGCQWRKSVCDRSQLGSQHSWKHKRKPRKRLVAFSPWFLLSKDSDIILRFLLVPCWPVVAQTKFQLQATKVLAKAFVSDGDQSSKWNLLLWKHTY